MKIALIGYGKMGKQVEAQALESGHEIVSIFTSTSTDWSSLEQADVAIDFSIGSAIRSNVEECAKRGTDLVIGTTGWDDQLSQVKTLIELNQIGVLYAPNFSLGVYLFLKLISYASSLMEPFSEYDAAVFETHHNKKKDAPSGTGQSIQEILEQKIARFRDKPITSLRLGSVIGEHTLQFDSACDAITLSHKAKNRQGFAQGALKAAEWIREKRGFYTLDDFMKELAYVVS